jgi:putative sigma-54 modulation protein
MKTAIRTHTVVLPSRVRQQIERRMYIALRSFARYIDEVLVLVRDVNGPRGGRDLLGQVIVRLRRGVPIVVRAKEDNVSTLVAKLASAVRRAVKSRIRRRRTRFIRLFRRRQRLFAAAEMAEATASG